MVRMIKLIGNIRNRNASDDRPSYQINDEGSRRRNDVEGKACWGPANPRTSLKTPSYRSVVDIAMKEMDKGVCGEDR